MPGPSTEEVFTCTYCTREIRGLRVRCTHCKDAPVFLCAECFSCCVELGSHKRTHPYEIIDDGNFSIFKCAGQWRAMEETQLLKAVEQYGFGNWEDIAQALPDRTIQEVKQHYDDMYINGNIGRETWSRCRETKVSEVTDRTLPDGGPLSPSLSSPSKPVTDLTIAEQHELGYMPNRDDFEREFDNDAETLISTLAICEEDDPVDKQAKMALIDSYSRRLAERLRRKKIAREHNVLPHFFKTLHPSTGKSSSKSKSNPKESKFRREVYEKMKPYMQYLCFQEMESYLDNLEKQVQLKSRIKELLKYRKNGLTRFEEIREYEAAKKRRERVLSKRTQASGIAVSASATSLGDHQERVERKEEEGGPFSQQRSNNNHKDVSKTSQSQHLGAEGGHQVGGKDGFQNHNPQERKSLGPQSAQLPKAKRDDKSERLTCGEELLLSSKEKQICNSLGLSAGDYVNYKMKILSDLRQSPRSVNTRRPSIEPPKGLDQAKTKALVQHFYSAGWVK